MDPWFILTITSVNMDRFLTIFTLLQQEIHDTQKLSYFCHLTFIMLPLYLAKQTLVLVSVLHVCFNEVNGPQLDLKSN